MMLRVTVREQPGAFVRLATYTVGGAPSWDEEWDKYTAPRVRTVMEYYRRYPVVYPTLLRYLPRDGDIVEGGSGLGFWVGLLQEAGFRINGLDRSPSALRLARETFPELRFDEGDVLSLPYPDQSLAGYVSFGVAEHFREGPEAMLGEAARVLRAGGILVVTVPWLSPLRRFRRRHTEPPPGAHFYQYFFSRAELFASTSACGFTPVYFSSYAPWKTLRDEWLEGPQGAAVQPRPAARGADVHQSKQEPGPGFARRVLWQTHNAVLENALARRLAGHMALLVARKV